MSVRIKVIQQEMPIVGNTERLVSTYGEFDSDRRLSEFFTTYLPFLSVQIAQAVVFPSDGICQRKIVITIDYGDKDISELIHEVEK